MKQERNTIEIGEPHIDVLPVETQDYFYTILLSRITNLIQQDCKADELLSETTENTEGDNV